MRTFVLPLATLSLALAAGSVSAQPSGECTGDSTDPACGAPEQTGGGGCGCGGGSILINFTDQGDSYQYADDFDDDGMEDGQDNCPFHFNVDQNDGDGDGFGDACDQDLDNDGIDNRVDNCLQVPNVDQRNADRDSLGDACDPKLCYVVDGDEQGCLDPVAPFAVKASLADQRRRQVQTGDEVLMHIFANREDTAIRYTWAVVDAPSDGNAAISRPTGGVFFSQGIQYVYEADRNVRFSATTPGVYTLELLAELAFDDSLGYDVKTARSRVTVEVGGQSLSSCDHTGGVPWAAAALVGVVLLGRRRRSVTAMGR